MSTLARIAFVADLVKAELLTPAQGIAALNHADKRPEDFARHLAQFGLEVRLNP